MLKKSIDFWKIKKNETAMQHLPTESDHYFKNLKKGKPTQILSK